MIKNVVAEQSMIENTRSTLMAQDEEIRKTFLEELPEFVGNSVKTLLNDITDEEFKKCHVKSGDNYIQYEIRAKVNAGEQINNKEVRHSTITRVSDNAIGRWMKELLEHDAHHIAQLNYPKHSGGGADQYLKEGLFNTYNLGDINVKFSEVIAKVAKTNDHVRLLVSTDWGSCCATLTLTFPKSRIN